MRKTTTNTDGVYDFPSVVPGAYSMQASATGFTAVSQPAVTLEVGQTATFDFQLKVGATTSTVTVNAIAPALETSTSELGTVVAPKEMNDLPLNGRNFTELLTILPGTVNLNTDQNSGGGGGWNGASIGQFSFPAVNGARNRSNMFILDGANDLNTLSGTYNYAPIVDAIQEFKSQGHNDLAEYGGAAGAAGERGHEVRNQPVPWRSLGVPSQRGDGFARLLRGSPRSPSAEPVWRFGRRSSLDSKTV